MRTNITIQNKDYSRQRGCELCNNWEHVDSKDHLRIFQDVKSTDHGIELTNVNSTDHGIELTDVNNTDHEIVLKELDCTDCILRCKQHRFGTRLKYVSTRDFTLEDVNTCCTQQGDKA